MLNDGSIINVINIAKSNDDVFIIGEKYEKQKDLFSLEGISSDLFGITIVRKSNEIVEYLYSVIHSKVFKIPVNGGFVTYPIIHTLEAFN